MENSRCHQNPKNSPCGTNWPVLSLVEPLSSSCTAKTRNKRLSKFTLCWNQPSKFHKITILTWKTAISISYLIPLLFTTSENHKGWQKTRKHFKSATWTSHVKNEKCLCTKKSSLQSQLHMYECIHDVSNFQKKRLTVSIESVVRKGTNFLLPKDSISLLKQHTKREFLVFCRNFLVITGKPRKKFGILNERNYLIFETTLST